MIELVSETSSRHMGKSLTVTYHSVKEEVQFRITRQKNPGVAMPMLVWWHSMKKPVVRACAKLGIFAL
jgi:hypothetical protein